MARKSYGNIDCKQIYPVLETQKQVDQLKTVAFQLTKQQAINLARNLLSASLDTGEAIDVTAFRLRNIVTVTSVRPG
jgi:uncharacterized protein YoaH (UPF0181 family)